MQDTDTQRGPWASELLFAVFGRNSHTTRSAVEQPLRDPKRSGGVERANSFSPNVSRGIKMS
jgi:hypothetical protein